MLSRLLIALVAIIALSTTIFFLNTIPRVDFSEPSPELSFDQAESPSNAIILPKTDERAVALSEAFIERERMEELIKSVTNELLDDEIFRLKTHKRLVALSKALIDRALLEELIESKNK
jgi:hypothetical protein